MLISTKGYSCHKLFMTQLKLACTTTSNTGPAPTGVPTLGVACLHATAILPSPAVPATLWECRTASGCTLQLLRSELLLLARNASQHSCRDPAATCWGEGLLPQQRPWQGRNGLSATEINKWQLCNCRLQPTGRLEARTD